MIWYGAQRARLNQGLGASGLRGPEPKSKYIYLSIYLSVPTSPIRPHHAVWHGLGKGWVRQCMWVSKQLVLPSICTTLHVLKAQRTTILITTDIIIKVRDLFLSEWSAGCARGPDSHIQPWHDGRTATRSTPQHGDGVPPESQCALPSTVPHSTGMVPLCIC